MKKPNLFMVGAPRSGTTSLYVYLRQHPDVFVPEIREPNYFCIDLHNKGKREFKKGEYAYECKTEQEYMDIYSNWKSEKIGFDASSGRYLYSKYAAEEIHKFNQNAKIIILLRNPVDFMHSLHAHYLSHLAENIQDFEKALEAEQERKQGKNLPKGVLCQSMYYYSEISKFTEQIKRYSKLFPKKQIKIIIADDFKKNPETIYKEVLKFININSNFTPEFKITNKNKEIRKSVKILQHFPNLWRFTKNKFPKTYNRLKKLALKTVERKKIDPILRKKLMNKYRQEVENLSKIINRDLIKLWSYDGL